jgi:hypothetical protein
MAFHLPPHLNPLPQGERIKVRGGEWERVIERFTNIDPVFLKDSLTVRYSFPSPPIRQWRKGEVVREDYSVNVPLDAPAGKYDIIIGLWDPEGSKERLKLKGKTSDEIKIGEIEIS